MVQQLADDRLPYIDFERRSVEYKDFSGGVNYKDMDFAIIIPMGGKDKVERGAEIYIKSCEEHVAQRRMKPALLREIKAAYKEFKENRAYTFEGTPMSSLGLTKSQLDMLQELHFRAVEDLALANEEAIGRMGMGGRALKAQAQSFLDSKPQAETAAEITALRLRTDAQDETIKRQQAQLEQLIAVNRMKEGSADVFVQHQPSALAMSPGMADDDAEERILGKVDERLVNMPESYQP